MHKSSTDLPVLLQYNNLADDQELIKGEEEYSPEEDELNAHDFKLFSTEKYREDNISNDETPRFDMKEVPNKFSNARAELECSSSSIYLEESKEKDLAVILERETEDEVTE